MRPRTMLSLAALFSTSTLAHAGLVTLTLQNGNGGGGEFNTTAFSITNNSAAGINLTQASFTIGNTQYLFDQLYLSEEAFSGGNGTQTASLLVGDRIDDNAGPDLFTYGFTNFAPSISFRGQWDIDNDNGDFNADARLVMFNNGTAPNAVASFTFSDGSTINYTFPDLASQTSYTFTIPTPATAALIALASPMTMRRRRR